MDINSTWTLRVCQIWIPSGNRPRPACRVLPFLYRSLATRRPRLWRREIGRYAPLRDWQRLWLCLLDRKSTRLNSSHQIISYAVFCLKKKKKTEIKHNTKKKKKKNTHPQNKKQKT